MQVTFEQYVSTDAEHLIDFITSDTWPYFVYPRPSRELVQQWIDEGSYNGDANRVFWVLVDDQRAGILRLHDLDDDTPMIDIRLHSAYRRQGIGEQALRWCTGYVFTTMPNVTRFEGQTRQDNIAMRKLFRRCGFVKEAHYRQAWPGAEDTMFDGISYGILRQDWAEQKVTPVHWNDEPT